MKTKKYTDQQFVLAVKTSNNIRQVCLKLHLKPYGTNYQIIKNKIIKMNLNTEHFNKTPIKKPTKYCFNLEQILVEGSYYKNMTALKERLLSNNLLKMECGNCHKKDYDINGTKINMPLELHHIDGDRKNNKIENLILLCPICHYLTKNFRGKNKQHKEYIICSDCGKQIRKNKFGFCRNCYIKNKAKDKNMEEKINICKCGKPIKNRKHGLCRKCYNATIINPNKPSKEILMKQIREESFVKLGEKYKVSDNTIRKWCKSYNIDFSYASGGRKKSLQGLKKGKETQSNLRKIRRTCPICGKTKYETSKVCRQCYLKQQQEIVKKEYMKHKEF